MSSCLSITPRAPGFPRNIYTIHPDALEQRGIVTMVPDSLDRKQKHSKRSSRFWDMPQVGVSCKCGQIHFWPTFTDLIPLLILCLHSFKTCLLPACQVCSTRIGTSWDSRTGARWSWAREPPLSEETRRGEASTDGLRWNQMKSDGQVMISYDTRQVTRFQYVSFRKWHKWHTALGRQAHHVSASTPISQAWTCWTCWACWTYIPYITFLSLRDSPSQLFF